MISIKGLWDFFCESTVQTDSHWSRK